jgi:predicted ATPase/DNA-binding CsgD family transcriptional regulator
VKNNIRGQAAAAQHQLPDPLFGREHDLAAIAAMLQTPECRLVTLSGPGGIGKTRLAQHIAERLSAGFEDGVTFIPLHDLNSTQQVAVAILEHLGCGVHGTDEPAAQLARFLQDQCVLLVLDNFEHLLEARSLLTDILEQTRHIKMLVTSREVLNLHQEWVWQVRGLEYPQAADTVDAMGYAAVRMFTARARRVSAEFSDEHDLSAIIEICALVEGNPLAIELAAVWLKSLTCRGILDELRRDIDTLSTGMEDVPPPHRSIRAVFDHSWRLLTCDEQQALMRLSMFQGSFTRDAAKGVARASPLMLNTLINKSLLSHNPRNGRYQFHELFRQYVVKLLNNDDQFAGIEAAFITYFRDFLAARSESLWTSRQREIVEEVAAELDHIRRFAVRLALTDNSSASRKAAYTLSEIYHLRGYYRDAVQFLSEIITQLDAGQEGEFQPEHVRLLAETLNGLGWSFIRLGEFKAAEAALMCSQAIYETYQIQPAVGLGTDPHGGLGELSLILGDTATARKFGEAVYVAAGNRNDPLNSSTALYLLSAAALAEGDCSQAKAYVEQAIMLARQAGNDWFLACCLYQMGHIRSRQRDYASASAHYKESFCLREAFGDHEGQAVALGHLGELALLQGQFTQASETLQKSFHLYQQIGDRRGLFTAHQGLALACTALRQYDQAYHHLLDALELVRETQLTSWWLSLCEAAGEFFAATGAVEYGVKLVRLGFQHPESDEMTRTSAERWLHQARPPVTNRFEIDLNIVIPQFEQDLRGYTWKSPVSPHSHNGHSTPVESLSPRELEILYLIDQGMTNQEIADQLVLMVSTVKTYNYSIFGKLDVKNRGQAVIRARQMNLL